VLTFATQAPRASGDPRPDPAPESISKGGVIKRITLIVALLILASALLAGNRAQTAAVPGLHQTVSFAKAIISHSPVMYPNSLAAGDLNGDGFADIAVVSFDNSQLTWYGLGKGNGHFDHWSDKVPAVYEPSFVFFADVDGDGNLDAITTDFEPSFTVAFGDGKGHFPSYMRPNTGNSCWSVEVAVADVNGDGIPDIVGTCFADINGPGTVFVLLGEGNRKFQKVMHFSSGGQEPYGIVVGDLNQDGIPDVIVANNGSQKVNYGNIAVLLGKGDGTFDKPVRYQAGNDPYQLVLADFNGDGNLDAAVASPNDVNTIRVLLGKGDGTFGAAKAYPSGLYPISIVSADFNGDGIPDLAVSNYSSPKPCHVSVMLGNGDGTFQPPVHFRVGVSPTQLVVADFNHDGKPDLATINGGDSTISVLLNTTQFPTPSPIH
jgi:hypothetical protein